MPSPPRLIVPDAAWNSYCRVARGEPVFDDTRGHHWCQARLSLQDWAPCWASAPDQPMLQKLSGPAPDLTDRPAALSLDTPTVRIHA